jgi:hypothetical protein
MPPKPSCFLFLQVLSSRSSSTGPSIRRLSTGIPLPEDLLLVHEFKDHYSLQPAREMSLDGRMVPSFDSRTHFYLFSPLDLNHSITSFFKNHATKFTKEEWLAKYTRPSMNNSRSRTV